MPAVATYARSFLGRFRFSLRRRRGPELRVDPRDNPLHSLRNLLRYRAESNEWPALAVGTSYDVLIAATEEGHRGEELIINARHAIQQGLSEPSTLRFACGNQILLLAADGRARPQILLEVAERVRCIMREGQQN